MGLSKFKFAMSRFITIPTTCYFSFLSISTSIRFDGRVACGFLVFSAWPARGRDGYCKVIVFVRVSQLH